ncbi:MAG: hypothetical protein PUA51_05105 [Oscillospiraceae bacterium]|nr:hypothetical protein [Oscillospiraceae bacterium]
MSVSKIFDIPKYYYFQSGNDYSGSKGDFSYKIITSSDNIKCLTWHGKLCSMKAEIENQKEFEKSENGFSELIAWLEEMYKS